ncbi:hypothetical protein CEQ90_04945 [Lewinellaceae bacterium SD302]|nr:hypothetical protein CEQ90_04945 [Lewinellaceae bacterium SD302]
MNIQSILFTILLSATALFATGCEDDDDCMHDVCAGTIATTTGSPVGACGTLLQMDIGNGPELFEPNNLNDFFEMIELGEDLCIEYEFVTGVGSFCQTGPIIEITSAELQ